MKNLLIIGLLLAAAGGALFAQTAQPPQDTSAPAEATSAAAPAPATETAPAGSSAPAPAASSFLRQELTAAGSELSSNQVGTMTMDDIEKIAAHLSIAFQKGRYVERVRAASYALPGLGQFMAGDTLGGWLYVAWDVTILAGTLISAYFVLPPNVQFGSLDYLNSPLSTIRAAWESNSVLSYLPLAAVIAGGVILEMVLRSASAENAAQTARKNIDAGKVTFEPTLDFGGGAGIGMKLAY
ncbi:MAG TPA: hypothetical protein VMV03_12060 [Spirochaetia bacterium]|nr:hypothetical protein [Spirochaetia bacterium]